MQNDEPYIPSQNFYGGNYQKKSSIQGGKPKVNIKVCLHCFDTKELIKDVPIEFDDENVLLTPILKHIKYLGKPIAFQSVSYYSEEDEMDVFVGIEGQTIKPSFSIPLEELSSGGKYKLTIKITKHTEQDKEFDVPSGIPSNNRPAAREPVGAEDEQNDTQMVPVSLPEMNSASQVDNVLDGITKPIKRERATKEEMMAKMKSKVSFRYTYQSPIFTSLPVGNQLWPALNLDFY